MCFAVAELEVLVGCDGAAELEQKVGADCPGSGTVVVRVFRPKPKSNKVARSAEDIPAKHWWVKSVKENL